MEGTGGSLCLNSPFSWLSAALPYPLLHLGGLPKDAELGK